MKQLHGATPGFLHSGNRISALEKAVYKESKREKATEQQRFLIHYYLGFLDTILQKKALKKEKAEEVSIMLDIDPNNAQKFLNDIEKWNEQEPSKLRTLYNYTFLAKHFNRFGYKKEAAEANRILTDLENKKDKKGSSKK